MTQFAAPGDSDTVENGTEFTPRFDSHGLIACVVTDAADGAVLMLAHMNADALARTIESGEAWFWSRSRQALWRKGETSGNRLRVEEMRVDCDQDAVLVRARVEGRGIACHTGRRSCFYRRIPLGDGNKARALEFLGRR